MNREEIIRMAREAGWDAHHAEFDTRIQAFAAQVDAAARAEENEACARLCDQMFHDWCNQAFEDEDEACRNKPDAEDCKKAIRARGNT
jgi:hypothetical protein